MVCRLPHGGNMRNVQGFSTRRTRSGILVTRVHYTADPERDSDWAKSERLKYSSQAAWDREPTPNGAWELMVPAPRGTQRVIARPDRTYAAVRTRRGCQK